MSQTPTSYQPYTPGRPGPEDAPLASREKRYGGGPDCMVIASVVCVVVWATSGFGYFWPIWVLLPTVLLRSGRLGGLGPVRACGRIERRKN